MVMASGLANFAGRKHASFERVGLGAADGSWARRWAAKPGLVAYCWAFFGLEIGPAKMGPKMGLTLGPNLVMGIRPKNNK